MAGGRENSLFVEFCFARWKSSGDLLHNNKDLLNPTERFSKNWLYNSIL